LCGLDGLVHGGIITLLLEEVAQWFIIGCLGRLGITTEISVRYLKPVPTNTELHVLGQIIKQEEKSVVMHCAIHSSDNVLLVEGESNWALPSLSTFAKITSVDELKLRECLSRYPLKDKNCSK